MIVLAILLPFAFSGLRLKLGALTSKDWRIIAALGFTGGGVHRPMQWLGLHFTTATSGILYLSTTPVFILLMAMPLGERIGARQWAGVLVSFCGVFLIATRGTPARLSFNVGGLMGPRLDDDVGALHGAAAAASRPARYGRTSLAGLP